jgi:hypothetical protein
MTTGTATTATEDQRSLHAQGADLLQELLAQLVHFGYRKAAVDTWRNDQEAHNIRHAYAGGEWTLTHWHDGAGYIEVRYTVRATMPDIKTLLASVLPVPF